MGENVGQREDSQCAARTIALLSRHTRLRRCAQAMLCTFKVEVAPGNDCASIQREVVMYLREAVMYLRDPFTYIANISSLT